jgi:hypothetical protein
MIELVPSFRIPLSVLQDGTLSYTLPLPNCLRGLATMVLCPDDTPVPRGRELVLILLCRAARKSEQTGHRARPGRRAGRVRVAVQRASGGSRRHGRRGVVVPRRRALLLGVPSHEAAYQPHREAEARQDEINGRAQQGETTARFRILRCVRVVANDANRHPQKKRSRRFRTRIASQTSE